MKNILTITLLLALSFSSKINAQQKIYSKQDIGKFETHKNYYVGKKVKDLLKDLKIDIQQIILGGGTEANNIISIRFIDKISNQEINFKPARINLFIKERDNETNSLFRTGTGYKKIIKRDSVRYKTNEDILKEYENLTIIDIYASSEKM